MANDWMNDDGLYIKYGTKEVVVTTVGEPAAPDNGTNHVVVIDLDLTTLTSSAAIIADSTVLPDGAFIDEVELWVLTAADSSGNNAALNVGLVRQDRSTTYDEDGLIDAEAEGDIDAVGDVVVYRIADAGDAGALVGTTLANTGYITADYDTEAFTAGEVRIRIKYHMTE